jgi:hypothetical protein
VSDSLAPTPSDVERVVDIVRTHQHAEKVGALVFDLVSRQAEGRVLFSGERFVAARAEEHGVDARMAETPLGNVLGLLERGAITRMDWALMSALHVRGFSDAWQARAEDDRRDLVARFATHADWLEASTHHRPLVFARELLPAQLAGELWKRIGVVALEEDKSPTPAGRGRNALRLSVLSGVTSSASAGADSARAALERVKAEADDPWTRALAGAALQNGAAEPVPASVPSSVSTAPTVVVSSNPPPPGTSPPVTNTPSQPPLEAIRIAGVLARAPAMRWWAPLRWLSGFAVVRWIVAGFAALLGVRRHVFVELQGQALSVRIATRWLGRTVRSSDVVHGLAHVAHVKRVARYASLHLLVGVTLFAAGILIGGFLLGDGLRSQDQTLLLAGAGLILGGAALDLVLGVIVPATARRVRIELDFGEHGRLDVAGVPADDADRLMHSLLEHVATRA